MLGNTLYDIYAYDCSQFVSFSRCVRLAGYRPDNHHSLDQDCIIGPLTIQVGVVKILHLRSPLRLIALDAWATLHLIFEGAELITVGAARSTKVALSRIFVLRHMLWAESRSSVIGLMLIKGLLGGLTWSCLWQCPSGHILLVASVGGEFRSVTTWSNRSRRCSLIF